MFLSHFHAMEKEMATHSSVLAWRIPGTGEPGGLPVTKCRISLGSRIAVAIAPAPHHLPEPFPDCKFLLPPTCCFTMHFPVGPTSFEFLLPPDSPITISPLVGTVWPGKVGVSPTGGLLGGAVPPRGAWFCPPWTTVVQPDNRW